MTKRSHLIQVSYRVENALRDRKYGKVLDKDANVETRELADKVHVVAFKPFSSRSLISYLGPQLPIRPVIFTQLPAMLDAGSSFRPRTVLYSLFAHILGVLLGS